MARRRARAPLYRTYADAVAAGALPPPRTEFDHLLHGIRPITAEDPSPVILCTEVVAGVGISRHRYLPRAPRDLTPEQKRAFHEAAEANVPWVDGPPLFVRQAMARSAP